MSSPIAQRPTRLRLVIRVCAAYTAGSGLVALLLWFVGSPPIAAVWSNTVSSPSTAVFFVLYGVALLLRSAFPTHRGIRWLGTSINVAGAVVALLLFVLQSRGVYLEIEHAGITIVHVPGTSYAGHMSRVTALFFVLAALSFLASLPAVRGRLRSDLVAVVLAGIVLAAGLVFTLAYLLGTPLSSGGSFIPPSAMTCAAAAALGVALLGLASPPRTTTEGEDRRSGVVYLVAFVVLAAGIVSTGSFYFRQYGTRFRVQVERELAATAELKVVGLLQWRAERLGDAAILSQNAALARLVRRTLERPADAGAREELRSWLSSYRADLWYDRIRLLDARGVSRFVDPADVVGPASSSVLRGASEALRSGQVMLQDFYRSENDGRIYLGVLAPILDEHGGGPPLGVLFFRVNPATYFYHSLETWPVPSRTAEVLLIRRDVNDALFLNPLRFSPDAALTLRVALGSRERPAAKAVLGEEGLVEGRDYRGVPVEAVARRVPDSPWFLVAKMDDSEVMAPLRERWWFTVALVGVLLLGLATGLGLLWRQQRVRFYRERYRAAEALRVLGSRQEALLAAVPDIIMEVDANRVYTWANRPGIEFFGEDVLGKEAAAYFEGEPDTHQAVEPVFNGPGDVIYVESRQRRRDGQKRLLAWWRRALTDAAGNVTGALSTARDITDQRGIEEAVRRQEQFLRVMLESQNDGVVACDENGSVVLFNKTAREFHGVDVRDIPPEQWSEYYTLYDADGRSPLPRNANPLVRAFNGERVEQAGMVIKAKGQEPRYVAASGEAFYDDAGRRLGAVVVMRDVTDLKKSIESLREIARDLRHAEELGHLGHWSVDLRTNRVSCSEEVFRIYGVAADVDLTPERMAEFVHPEDRDRSGRAAGETEYRIVRPDGSLRYLAIDGEVQHDEAGEAVAVFWTVQDVTELRHKERELAERNEELARFTYAVSHDLRSPLVTIKTFVGYLEQDFRGPDATRMEKDLAYIHSATDKMGLLLDELLELSRVGRTVSPSADAPLQSVVRDALALVAGRIAERGVRVDVTEEPVVLFGDRRRLVEVFQNLVDNAVGFMGDQPAPRVEIGVEADGVRTVLFVRDNGIGIDQRHLPKLFGLFEKLDSGSAGSGMGLALVKRIVEVHGGRIWVESEGLGKGAIFRFTLAGTKLEGH
jgi:PAS domain S-box-containing protein